MTGCCEPDDYESVFTGRFARRAARRYRRHGLSPTAKRIVRFISENGVRDATVLEIGGGVGEIQLELLNQGASHATNLEISTNYETEATRLLASSGAADRVTRRFLDIATAGADVEPADVVVLHRVVCCYPDYGALLSAAGSHARRLLVYSHPAENRATRAMIWSENAIRRLRRNEFRAYVHPTEAMVATAEAQGLSATYRHHAWDWEVVGLKRG